MVGVEMPCGAGGQVRMSPMAPWLRGVSYPLPLCVGWPWGGGREGAGSGAAMLVRSQPKADSGLLNFSQWRIKQAVADCPQAKRAGWARATLPAPAPPAPALPAPQPARCSASPLSAGC